MQHDNDTNEVSFMGLENCQVSAADCSIEKKP